MAARMQGRSGGRPWRFQEPTGRSFAAGILTKPLHSCGCQQELTAAMALLARLSAREQQAAPA